MAAGYRNSTRPACFPVKVRYEPVAGKKECPPPEGEQSCFLAAAPQSHDHIVALFPQRKELRNQLWRILKVAVDLDGGVAPRIPTSVPASGTPSRTV